MIEGSFVRNSRLAVLGGQIEERFLRAQVDAFPGSKREERASTCFARNDQQRAPEIAVRAVQGGVGRFLLRNQGIKFAKRRGGVSYDFHLHGERAAGTAIRISAPILSAGGIK